MMDSSLGALLDQYNLHWNSGKAFDHLIPRPFYNDRILELADRREIVVLQGIRRSGKSSLLKLAIRSLIAKKHAVANLFFMNLEDYRFGSEKTVDTLDQIFQAYLDRMKPQGRIFVFLDEIQEIPQFEKWLRTYYEQREDIKFIVTGSSSSLFSAELATLLTGRQISMEIFPFSFMERLHFADTRIYRQLLKKPIDTIYLSPAARKIEPHIVRFLDSGGFPEVVKHDQPENNVLLLQQYIGDIILRDIAQRYHIRKVDVLQKLVLNLIYNMGGPINVSRLAQQVGSNRTTVLDLMKHLREVYMIFTAPGWSFDPADQTTSTRAKHVFCIDNGFFAAINSPSDEDFSKKVRNTVFLQLRFQWKGPVYYWKNQVEIDFILDGGFPIAVLGKDSQKEQALQRLFHYMHSHNLPRGLLISWSKLQIIPENGRRILMVPLWIFLAKSRQEIMTYLTEEN